MSTRTESAPVLAARLVAGERRAVAEALTRLEQGGSDAGELLASLLPHLGNALVAGLTGPPGAGKSTLANALIVEARSSGRRVAVLAVDPSSPVSGGAILGDRIRMVTASTDDGVMVRSLGSRGALGGLTPAAVRMIDALDAAGFGLILIETVGTGQNEIDVAEIADVVMVVSAPGLGDGIQAMKAGLIEIADVLVVNKADREGADRTVADLEAALSLRAGRPGERPEVPVVKTSAATGLGVAGLWRLVAERGAARQAEGLVSRRRRRARYLIARAAAEIIARRVREGTASTDELADGVLAGRLDPAEAARRLLADRGGSGGA
ncbi:MAG: methylmalonyl Co-A mutase-associated GTPase MeaB [Hyphomicrobiaceae bacterium]